MSTAHVFPLEKMTGSAYLGTAGHSKVWDDPPSGQQSYLFMSQEMGSVSQESMTGEGWNPCFLSPCLCG